MLAMPGLRTFALAAKPGSEGVSCDARGVSVGGVPLLQHPGAGNPFWSVRQLGELNKDLSVRYRLPIDIASKSSSLALIAAALNRGDLAMAAIAAVQMQIPDPPLLAKRTERPDETTQRARDLTRSGLLKFWDPALHPRAGVPPNPGWFAPTADDSESSAAPPNPSWLTPVSDKPQQLEPVPHDKTAIPRISRESHPLPKAREAKIHLAGFLSFRSQGDRQVLPYPVRRRLLRQSRPHPLALNRVSRFPADCRGSARQGPTATSPGKTARRKVGTPGDVLEVHRCAHRMPR